jgi:hypothetical protein
VSRRGRRGVPPDIRKRLEAESGGQQHAEEQRERSNAAPAANRAPAPVGRFAMGATLTLMQKIGEAQDWADWLIEQCEAAAAVTAEYRAQLEDCRAAIEDAFQAASWAAGVVKAQRQLERGEDSDE